MEAHSLQLKSLWQLCVTMSFFLFGCATTDYVAPDYKEFTTGGIFVDKYWSFITGGKNVKLEGTFVHMTPDVVAGTERLAFDVEVPEGLALVRVYAGRAFAPELYALKRGDKIAVYGKTRPIRMRARVGGGLVGNTIAVELHKLEKL